MNQEIERFHEDLIQLINNSKLPVGAVYYILKDCLAEVSHAYSISLRQSVQTEEE